ncbi:hypothetical protein BU14_0031s0006 [Porphyra umbilicalis]|uniref:Uncharacterized protein n=1 Tax=Porphyra umbilicalis TaxID=2786 RepID=A0A1X6PIY0_PORUM|nr:hypothetical protein BU14_0031s0006 [Porphyra umbilicalis]|eukprot:OSX80834.1 hypothetical protein BU14_0031s0006 [Porphyra umbilicalis]
MWTGGRASASNCQAAQASGVGVARVGGSWGWASRRPRRRLSGGGVIPY